MTKKQISVEYIQGLLDEIEKFNSYNLNDIELTENDKPIKIPDKILSEFRFIGLSNSWFIEDRFWETNLEKLQKES